MKEWSVQWYSRATKQWNARDYASERTARRQIAQLQQSGDLDDQPIYLTRSRYTSDKMYPDISTGRWEEVSREEIIMAKQPSKPASPDRKPHAYWVDVIPWHLDDPNDPDGSCSPGTAEGHTFSTLDQAVVFAVRKQAEQAHGLSHCDCYIHPYYGDQPTEDHDERVAAGFRSEDYMVPVLGERIDWEGLVYEGDKAGRVLRDDARKAQETAAEARRELQRETTARYEAQDERDKVTAERDALAIELHAIKLQLEASEAGGAAPTDADLQARVNQLESIVRVRDVELGEATGLRDQLIEVRNQRDQLISEVNNLRAAMAAPVDVGSGVVIEQQENELRLLRNQITELEQANAKLKEAAGPDSLTERALADLEKSFEELLDERDDLLAKLKDVERLTKQNASLKSQLGEARDRAKQLEPERDPWQDIVEKWLGHMEEDGYHVFGTYELLEYLGYHPNDVEASRRLKLVIDRIGGWEPTNHAPIPKMRERKTKQGRGYRLKSEHPKRRITKRRQDY